MSEIAVEVKNLSITYRERYKYNNISDSNHIGIYTAIDNMSFSVNKGEVLGIVGKNGCGKSTLLRTIASVYNPDSGSIDLHGNSAVLISIGKGFNNDLSGIDNIYLSGTLLGLSKRQIDEQLQEIISFSELEDFIYKPVRCYSNGMYSKLAFSIFSFLKPDILLVDEALSVGDKHFKTKSLQHLQSLVDDKNVTALIVSHNTASLRKLCSKVLWIDKGRVKKIGPTEELLSEYENC